MSTKNNAENIDEILKDIARRLEGVIQLLIKAMEKYFNTIMEFPIERCKDTAIYDIYIDMLSDIAEIIDSAEFMLSDGKDYMSAWGEIDEALDKLCRFKTLLKKNNEEYPEYLREVEKELHDIRKIFTKLSMISRGEEVELNYISYVTLVKQLDRILSSFDALSTDLQKLKEQIKALKEQLK